MTTETTPLGATGRRTATLVAGDMVALLTFAALGRRSHGEAAGLGAIAEVFMTALPFIVGWLAVAPWVGAFDPARTRGAGAMLRATTLGWLGGLLLGAVVRAALIGRFSPWSFYAVTFAVALLLLGGWRATFSALEGRGR